MNTIVSNVKTQFLLGAGLDVLHQESLDWLDTIAFWKDEMTFFNKLLNKSEPIEENLKAHRQMLDNLEKIHGDIFTQLEEDIIEHEKLLAKLERNEKGLSDWDYREKHRRLKARMQTMMGDFKVFKKVVFDYVKNL
jgi:translation initiation factor 2 alpha subunit (eIF-2alpha)